MKLGGVFQQQLAAGVEPQPAGPPPPSPGAARTAALRAPAAAAVRWRGGGGPGLRRAGPAEGAAGQGSCRCTRPPAAAWEGAAGPECAAAAGGRGGRVEGPEGSGCTQREPAPAARGRPGTAGYQEGAPYGGNAQLHVLGLRSAAIACPCGTDVGGGSSVVAGPCSPWRAFRVASVPAAVGFGAL